VDVEIRPEPDDQDRDAVEAAVAGLERPEPSPYESAWRRAGLDDDDDR